MQSCPFAALFVDVASLVVVFVATEVLKLSRAGGDRFHPSGFLSLGHCCSSCIRLCRSSLHESLHFLNVKSTKDRTNVDC